MLRRTGLSKLQPKAELDSFDLFFNKVMNWWKLPSLAQETFLCCVFKLPVNFCKWILLETNGTHSSQVSRSSGTIFNCLHSDGHYQWVFIAPLTQCDLNCSTMVGLNSGLALTQNSCSYQITNTPASEGNAFRAHSPRMWPGLNFITFLRTISRPGLDSRHTDDVFWRMLLEWNENREKMFFQYLPNPNPTVSFLLQPTTLLPDELRSSSWVLLPQSELNW